VIGSSTQHKTRPQNFSGFWATFLTTGVKTQVPFVKKIYKLYRPQRLPFVKKFQSSSDHNRTNADHKRMNPDCMKIIPKHKIAIPDYMRVNPN